jgi:hypothetical protein
VQNLGLQGSKWLLLVIEVGLPFTCQLPIEKFKYESFKEKTNALLK